MEEKMMKYVQDYMNEKGIDNPDDLDEKDYKEIMSRVLENPDEDMLKAMHEFDEFASSDPNLDKAYSKLDKAYETDDEKKALKYAREAYTISNKCFDAILLQVDLAESVLEAEKILEDGLKVEEKRLKKEGFFADDFVGAFYGVFETRPYIKGLYRKAHLYAETGKIKLAKDVCLEILRLNDSDNTGARYLLMAIYAYLEEEKPLKDLFKKYGEESLQTLFPMMAMYYKLKDYDKAREYLNKIKENNNSFVDFFKDSLEEDDSPRGYYKKGGSSEVVMYMSNYEFLIYSLPYLPDFVLSE